ncbi:NDR1/HIN1-like protein 6 isoform X4 [Cucurbita pepo subsp. pepo]|uniref:NDR1/HIN1-like protein 6 isoform X2 n=1 Tax=Cucurbita pepo subsp. pepo TaxID=3664 RepID=UPI000C9D7804|nr:NDR1/HIN1-like protein 6 isoform X2 [Cucurbita pepo subsp. pepo]XP_023513127.1 NDR1/HIN1-like protein 6 isoform X3 [Cucurbita pepo subsp. pepo]XP_023513128.1 NDR1/HIN1-like protein 6 isoform X4 [Cucurbita pepo subsp. pepo]
MAEHQKIYPLHDVPLHDVEAPPMPAPTDPLVPHGTEKSDAGPPRTAEATVLYPPFRRTIPVMHSKPPKKRRSCCCRCLCWTISILVLLLVLIGIVVGILYLVFRPKLPEYSIDKLQVTQFTLGGNDRLDAIFNLTLTTTNPNKKIGIYYEGGSHISAWYMETKLCEGALPKFYQGHRNRTVLNVPLVGVTENATALFTTLQQEQQQTGSIPLNLNVRQPVRIKLGSLKLMKVKFSATCRLLVDSVSANNDIVIKNSSCKFKLRL